MINHHSRKVRVFWTTALLVVAALWVIFAYAFTPALIQRAYRGESLPIFNHMITGQAHHAVSEYLSRWSALTTKLSLGLSVLGIYVLLAVIGWTRASVAEPPGFGVKVAISRPRILVVYVLAAVIVGGTVSDLIQDKEHWPFSMYPMYSGVVRTKTVSMLLLYGVVQRSPLIEIPLDKNTYLQPFDHTRTADALAHALQENRLDEGVSDFLQRYEALRQAGRHDGPPLVAMRLYRVTWAANDTASNINRPDQKDLLYEMVPRRDGSD